MQVWRHTTACQFTGNPIKKVVKTRQNASLAEDGTLSWEEKYESVKEKVTGGLAAMKKRKGILPPSMLFQVYKAFLESHLRYAYMVWGSLSNTKITDMIYLIRWRVDLKAFNLS